MMEPQQGSRQTQVVDRLSELPNSVISNILWFVPIIDVVRTTMLSRRWRNRWTTIPFLNLVNDTPAINYDVAKFRDTVNRALLRWNGNRVLKFKIDEVDNSIYSDIDLWLNFAKEKKVEELYLHFEVSEFDCDGDYGEDLYRVPQCVYSSSSLKLLSFKACKFGISRDVEWNHLKSLEFTECFEITNHLITQILSGSPLLEVLNLSFVDRGESLKIRSSSLKELSIKRILYLDDDDDLDLGSRLTIRTPNLGTLKIKGIPYTNCWLLNVSSLTRATIGFYGLIYWSRDDCNIFGNNSEGGFFTSQSYIAGKFGQVLQSIQHVRSVSLYYCCLKVLRAMKMGCMHSSFPNIKSLRIGTFDDNYEELVGLLVLFPRLERLVLQDKHEKCRDGPDAVKYETTIPNSFVLQLRIIEVTWSNGDSIFPALEILLKYASKLEKMVFRVNERLPPSSLVLASNKLMNMPRSSTNCKIDLMYF